VALRSLWRAVALLVCSLAAQALAAEDVTIILPNVQGVVSSPVRIVAEFPDTASITSTAVLVDNVEIPQAISVTPLDVNVAMSGGTHFLTVKGVRSDGTVVASSRWVNVSPPSTTGSASASSGSLVYQNIEEMSGWYTYPDQGHPVCSSTPALVGSPSVDGTSGKFYLGPNGQYNNCLWPIKLGSSSTVTHFKLDTYYQISNPAYSQGVEFSSNHHIGTQWYKFSVQCSYNKGIFSVWNTAGGHWSPTHIPCNRPALNSWDHLTVDTQISGGKAVFLSLTLNGVQYAINQSFYPTTKASSYGFGVHFQMNGDISGHAYSTWVDGLTFTAW